MGTKLLILSFLSTFVTLEVLSASNLEDQKKIVLSGIRIKAFCDTLGSSSPEFTATSNYHLNYQFNFEMAEYLVCSESIKGYVDDTDTIKDIQKYGQLCKKWGFDDEYCADVIKHLKKSNWSFDTVGKHLSDYPHLLQDNKYKKFLLTVEQWIFLEDNGLLTEGLDTLIEATYNKRNNIEWNGATIIDEPINVLEEAVKYFQTSGGTNRCNLEEMIGIYLIWIQGDLNRFYELLTKICVEDTSKTTNWKKNQLNAIAESNIPKIRDPANQGLLIVFDFLRECKDLIDVWYSEDPKKINTRWEFFILVHHIFPSGGLNKPMVKLVKAALRLNYTPKEFAEFLEIPNSTSLRGVQRTNSQAFILESVLYPEKFGIRNKIHDRDGKIISQRIYGNLKTWNKWLDPLNRKDFFANFKLLLQTLKKEGSGTGDQLKEYYGKITEAFYNSGLNPEIMNFLLNKLVSQGRTLSEVHKCLHFIETVFFSAKHLLENDQEYSSRNLWIPHNLQLIEFAVNLFTEVNHYVKLCDNDFPGYNTNSQEDLLRLLHFVLDKSPPSSGPVNV